MNKQLILSIIVVVSLLSVLPASVSADQYVSTTSDIQAAVDQAAANGGTVYFASGEYYVNIVIDSPATSFTLKGAGSEESELYADDDGAVIKVVNTGANVVTIEGFGIREGTGDTSGYGYPCGGGLYSNHANLVVTNCSFQNNEADYGGGMYNENATLPRGDSGYPAYAVVVRDCHFEDNKAEYGGGMYNFEVACITVIDCTFEENYASADGGGMYNDNSNVAVESCTFERNEAYYQGGGMVNYYSGTASASPGGDTDYAGDGQTEVKPIVTVSNCLFTGNYTDYGNGGGMFNCDASPVVTNCVFEYNEAYNGGGIMNGGDSAPVVTNCTLLENSAEKNGGGMMNADYAAPVVTECTFVENVATNNGGGMMNAAYSAPVVTNCDFDGNKSLYDGGGGGGGMMNASYSAPIIMYCTFKNNCAAWRGGGMYNTADSTPTITHSTFSRNEAIRRGAGMDNHDNTAPIVTNCVFVGNTVIGEPYSNDSGVDGMVQSMASAGGGGMYIGYESQPVITNCTFTQNSVPYYGISSNECGGYQGENGGGVKFNTSNTSTVTNCIIWGNFCGDVPNDVLDTEYGDVIIDYSNIGASFPGVGDTGRGFLGDGNIDADPLFVNAPADVSLRSASPCIDAGTDASGESLGNVTDDILGTPRPQRSAYDMGAYESAGASWSPVVIQPLARTQLASVLSLWEDLLEQLPDEPTDEMTALIAQIQEYVANAAQLTNPIYASGQLSKAAEAMQQLAALLA